MDLFKTILISLILFLFVFNFGFVISLFVSQTKNGIKSATENSDYYLPLNRY